MKKLLVLLAFLGVFIAPQAFASFDKNLAYGSKGASVKEMQEFLADQGIYSGPITGNFYSLTLKAVKAFQTKESIKPSGYWNLATRQRANDLLTADLADSDTEQATDPLPTQPVAAVLTDWCPNLQGQQDYVPFGFKRDGSGNCVSAAIDVNVLNPQPVQQPIVQPATPVVQLPLVKEDYLATRPALICDNRIEGNGGHEGCYIHPSHEIDGGTLTLTLTSLTGEQKTVQGAITTATGAYVEVNGLASGTYTYSVVLDSERFHSERTNTVSF